MSEAAVADATPTETTPAPTPAPTTLLTPAATTPEGATTPTDAAPPAASEGSEATTEPEAPAAPEPVAYELTAPEGLELTPEITEQVTSLFRDAGVLPDKAQALLDFHAQAITDARAAAMTEFTARVDGWKAATLADAEIGGAKWDAAKADVLRATAAFGGQPLLDALEETAAGTHPVILKALAQIGRSLAEDTTVRAGAGGTSTLSVAQRLYPSMKE